MPVAAINAAPRAVASGSTSRSMRRPVTSALNPQPGAVARPPTDDADRVAAEPEVVEALDDVPDGVGTALQDGAREVPPVVSHRQPGERPEDIGIPARRHGPTEGREEAHAVCASRGLAREPPDLCLGDAQDVLGEPSDASRGHEAGMLDQPPARRHVRVCLDERIGIADGAGGRGCDGFRRAHDVADQARLEYPGSDTGRVLVASPDDDRASPAGPTPVRPRRGAARRCRSQAGAHRERPDRGQRHAAAHPTRRAARRRAEAGTRRSPDPRRAGP